MIAKYGKIKYAFQLNEQYKEVWNIAIDKLTCNTKVKKELFENILITIGGNFITFLLIKGKRRASLQESLQFWKGNKILLRKNNWLLYLWF